jgi:hypothetical protein
VAYTPTLSMKDSMILRRLAWFYGKPMTKTLELIIETIAKQTDKASVCMACRDKSKCNDCMFSES